ncbi:MAG: hypothetical protein WC374_09240 [Phycisphaerae bacterium]|jgi:chromosome segregation ATPase
MKKHILVLMLLSLLILPVIFGCSGSQNPVKIVFPPEFGEEQKPQNTANQKRFEQQTETNQTGSISAAIKLSEKCDQLSDESNKLKEQNQILQQENQQIQTKLQQTENELAAAQKELSQANDLIMEMQVEVNGWKSDVLGFREEMRQADIAQLQTLQKIVELLGGETPQQLASANTVDEDLNNQ